jgi:hypothetical protein
MGRSGTCRKQKLAAHTGRWSSNHATVIRARRILPSFGAPRQPRYRQRGGKRGKTVQGTVGRIVLGFLAGAISVLVAHEGTIYLLHAAGYIPTNGWSMTPAIPPWGVPRLLNNVFWGGLWGVLFALLYERVPGGMAWLKGLIFGLCIVLISNWTLLPVIKGRLFGQPNQVLFGGWNPQRMLIVLAILGAFGLGLGIVYRLMARAPSREIGER